MLSTTKPALPLWDHNIGYQTLNRFCRTTIEELFNLYNRVRIKGGQPLSRPSMILTLIVVSCSPMLAQISKTCASICGLACPGGDYTTAGRTNCINKCTANCTPCLEGAPLTGVLYPKYYVMGLMYAPPGCTKTSNYACNTQSSVDYSNGSSMGTTVSVKSSFANNVNASVGFTYPSADLTLGASISMTQTTTDTNSETFKKSSTTEYKLLGNQDGINHDMDVFLIMLNPAIYVYDSPQYDESGCGVKVDWTFGVNPTLGTPTASIYELYVDWLRNPANIPANVAAQLKVLNFTSDDYQTILALDPFVSKPLSILNSGAIGTATSTVKSVSADPSVAVPAALSSVPPSAPTITIAGVAVDPNRYIPTTQTLPYEPPPGGPSCNGAACNCPAITPTIKNEFATDASQTVESQYEVSETASIAKLVGIFSADVGAKQTWTSSSTEDDSTDSSQSASLTLQCPSPAYALPQTSMTIYWDKLFGSFLFVPTELNAPLLSQGSVTDSSGKPLPHTPVALTISGKTLRTYTNNEGMYKFVAPPKFTASGTGQLSAGGTTVPATIGQTQVIKAVQ